MDSKNKTDKKDVEIRFRVEIKDLITGEESIIESLQVANFIEIDGGSDYPDPDYLWSPARLSRSIGETVKLEFYFPQKDQEQPKVYQIKQTKPPKKRCPICKEFLEPGQAVLKRFILRDDKSELLDFDEDELQHADCHAIKE